ncbi:MAG: DUF421 domain-containing protein [Chloroflexota bacterium]
MIGEEWPIVADLLGLGADNAALWQMAIRAVIVYLAAIVLVRLGEKRFLGKHAALDVILGFMLGSVLSRAITASAPFFETILGGALALVLIHWLFAVLSFHSDRFGDLVKGTDRVLVSDGDILWDKMRSSHISEQDLLSAVRANAQIGNVEQVKEARLERSGDISIVERQKDPRVVEIDVQDGVQVVRVQIG